MRFLVQLSSSKWAAERVWKKAMASDLLMMSKNDDSNKNSRYIDAQRRCRAGLGILMHSTGSLYNFYISQIHMHILPSFNDYHNNQQYTLLELKQYHISILKMIRSLIAPIEKPVMKLIDGAYTAAKLLQSAVLFNESSSSSSTSSNTKSSNTKSSNTKSSNTKSSNTKSGSIKSTSIKSTNTNNDNDAGYIIQKERHIFDVEMAMLQLRSLLSELTSELTLLCKKNYYYDNNGNSNDDSYISDRIIITKLKGLLATIGSV
jgi:hypothetical protein